MHQCKIFKFVGWCRLDSLVGEIFALVGKARTYLISNSLYYISFFSKIVHKGGGGQNVQKLSIWFIDTPLAIAALRVARFPDAL